MAGFFFGGGGGVTVESGYKHHSLAFVDCQPVKANGKLNMSNQ